MFPLDADIYVANDGALSAQSWPLVHIRDLATNRAMTTPRFSYEKYNDKNSQL